MKIEDYKSDPKRPFTGQEYLNSLRDDREVYIYGKRVKDVTTHPAFRNGAASIAQLYDALHSNGGRSELCFDTDTGNGGYTHKFFRYARSNDELRQQRDAIAGWSRESYGWMGRTPDYKAAFASVLGAYPEYYGKFADNAKYWYKRIQESALYFNHAIVNPPIDRHMPADQVKDVYIQLEKETDAGIIVSGAKVVATNSALTHYNFIGFGSAQALGSDPNFALMFIAPMDSPGVKLISRASYEIVAGAMGSPFDYPLSTRFDENDAILIMDKVLIPWENVLIYRDFDLARTWAVKGGFARLFPMQACTRLAVKLDFIAALFMKALECTGVIEFRGVKADLGEVVAWRNLFWSLTDAMWAEGKPWMGQAYLPDTQALQTYRVMAPVAYAKIKNIIFKTVTSGLIYLPSSVKDMKNPELDAYLSKYVRGSNGIDHMQRIKILKLLWDAMGSEFGGRHELYEINYAGSQDEVRLQCLRYAQDSGSMKGMMDLVDRCLSDYDENGWTRKNLFNSDDINMIDRVSVDATPATSAHKCGNTAVLSNSCSHEPSKGAAPALTVTPPLPIIISPYTLQRAGVVSSSENKVNSNPVPNNPAPNNPAPNNPASSATNPAPATNSNPSSLKTPSNPAPSPSFPMPPQTPTILDHPDRAHYREAMASLASGVSIVTSNGPAGECGITATAVCAVSSTPPTFLVCISKSSAMGEVFGKNGALCINILSSEQEDLGRHFAGMMKSSMEERFSWDMWDKGMLNQPMLRGALANLEGKVVEKQEVGTHYIYLVELKKFTIKEGNALVYFKRRFFPINS